MAERVKIPPCPFCKGTGPALALFPEPREIEEQRRAVPPPRRIRVGCMTCNARGPWATDADTAVHLWGRASPEAPGLVALAALETLAVEGDSLAASAVEVLSRKGIRKAGNIAGVEVWLPGDTSDWAFRRFRHGLARAGEPT